jgi:hypothetical protein
MKPQKKPTQSRKSYEPLPFYGFIQYSLTDGEKSFLKEQGVDYERLFDTMEGLIENGWTFKFGYDSYNHAFQTVVAQRFPDSPQVGYMLTGRGSTSIKSLRQALYIGEQVTWDLASFFKTHSQPRDEIDD